MASPANGERLSADKREDLSRRFDFLELSVGFSDHVAIGNAAPDELENAADIAGNNGARLVTQVFAHDSVQGWLHGAGGNLERLQEECANSQRQRQRHQGNLNVFPNGYVRVWPEPLGGGLIEPGHLLAEGVRAGFQLD